jgi:hypothetical protein
LYDTKRHFGMQRPKKTLEFLPLLCSLLLYNKILALAALNMGTQSTPLYEEGFKQQSILYFNFYNINNTIILRISSFVTYQKKDIAKFKDVNMMDETFKGTVSRYIFIQ